MADNMEKLRVRQDAGEALFRQGFNCAQSALGAFAADAGIERETLLRMGTAFGGGIVGRKEICGAASGMLMAAGLLRGNSEALPPEEKEAMTGRMRELLERFEARCAYIDCGDLLNAMEPGAVRRDYCAELVRAAVGILSEEVD